MLSQEHSLEQAIALAGRCHAGQTRKYAVGGRRLPFVVHPVTVMRTVWAWGAGNPMLLTAAVLHDVLEDSQVTCKQLAKDFGEQTAGIVKELTHDRRINGHKREYLRQFATTSISALVIKLADRFCNLTDCLLADPGRFQTYFAKSLPLIDILHQRRREIAEACGEEVSAAIVAAFHNLQQAAVGKAEMTRSHTTGTDAHR